MGIEILASPFATGLKVSPSAVIFNLKPGGGIPTDHFSTTDEVVSAHYGVEGKRRAVVLFLSEVALRDKPQTLLLHSSEEMS